MTVKISQKIVGYKVTTAEDKIQAQAAAEQEKRSNVIQMHENVERQDFLMGSTYKIKTPLSEHSLYITINDMILNEGTEYEVRRPFEIFINSKNMEQFQWIVALTRVISAVFRKGGDVTFLVDELKAVFDPRGGYFKRGGKFMPSIVAEIGEAIETHLKMIGLIVPDEMDANQLALIAEKRAAYESKNKESSDSQQSKAASEDSGFPPGAQLCTKCNTLALVLMDGCMTCLNCSDSKCG